LAYQQGWKKESAVARLMAALVQAAPEALRFERGKKSAAEKFPEFRAWHALLQPLFGIMPPIWEEKKPPIADLFAGEGEEDEPEEEEENEE
jgi:hypothetical protein